MKYIVIHTEARKELDGAIAYYEAQNIGLGLDLLTEVEEALRKIQLNPNVGTPYKIEGVRRYVIQRFPYVIFYAELEELIWIIAIAHGKRKPDYWKRRQTE
ncbi:type II toxin-antitoxin system RelE/ParE family toxin [Iningainema tapete]|uniref:Type II toxin-antitoxin system RelE/ParE family toxin n=1 Tax=Iningainema tapete BLCC-T55 TaxID=2748662 RepID=A0A8J7CFL6_9CYAN|nr:type II toxin-antitoxin system RelE/ParE family toxin [Iningainema tapete BLCC-T55]